MNTAIIPFSLITVRRREAVLPTVRRRVPSGVNPYVKKNPFQFSPSMTYQKIPPMTASRKAVAFSFERIDRSFLVWCVVEIRQLPVIA